MIRLTMERMPASIPLWMPAKTVSSHILYASAKAFRDPPAPRPGFGAKPVDGARASKTQG
jgi:hypothetical protein